MTPDEMERELKRYRMVVIGLLATNERLIRNIDALWVGLILMAILLCILTFVLGTAG